MLTIIVASLCFTHRAVDTLTVSPLLSDHCVLQRNAPVRIWGADRPGQSVTVQVAGLRQTVRSGADGKWIATLPPHRAGGPYELTIQGSSELTKHDVLYGEVWVCSGQSNMGFDLATDANATTEIAHSSDPELRMFTVPNVPADSPEDELSAGTWELAGPATSGHFSAVGYYFAKQLRKALGVPIGMLHTSWGGTRIEAWTSRTANVAQGMKLSEFVTVQERVAQDPALKARYERWVAAGSPPDPCEDPGRSPATKGWESGDSDEGWGHATAPGQWSTLGIPELIELNGGVWFRKDIDLPADQAGKPMVLHLAAIDDGDTTFFNGEQVGGIAPDVPNAWQMPRDYMVPGNLVKAGRNVIATRIWNTRFGAGIWGDANKVFLEGPDGYRLPLAGPWLYRIEVGKPQQPVILDPNYASVLYNGMLYPLRHATVQGAIWYQGEANAGDPIRYRSQLPAMIQDWRNTFLNPQMAFFLTQLAPFQNEGSQKTSYAMLREAESMAPKFIDRTGVAVITDVGDETNIHPTQKGPVGYRLALLAEHNVYGLAVVAQSPTLRGVEITGDKILVAFDHVGQGLTIRGGPSSGRVVPGDHLVGFQIAGEDKVFVEAQAVLVSSDRVAVSSPNVAAPKYIRFGFVNFPLVNLWSKDGLPAEPFRTDP